METNNLFSLTEYLTIFSAFIYGYIATHFFSGWGEMINFRSNSRFSLEHIGWTILSFGLLIDLWWASWLKSSYIGNGYLFFLFSLISPLIFYFISVNLFPPFTKEAIRHDYKAYVGTIVKRGYLLFIALFVSFILNTFVVSEDRTNEDLFFNFPAITLAGLGYFINKRFFNQIILSIGAIMLLIHIIIQPSYPPNEKVIEGFSITEYLTVFTSFIFGFIASRFLAGWGFIVTSYKKENVLKEHLCWTALSFIFLIDIWWGSWEREQYISTSLIHFFISLATPIAYYFLSAVIFPLGNIKTVELSTISSLFQSNRRLIYFFFGAILLTNFIVSSLMEENSLLNTENLFRGLGLLLAGWASLSKKRNAGIIVLVFGWVLLIIHSIIQ